MSTIASGSDVVVGMAMPIDRDAFQRDLAACLAEFNAFKLSIVSQAIEIPLRLKDEATAQLTGIMQALQAQAAGGINIPINVVGAGMGGGGGGPLGPFLGGGAGGASGGPGGAGFGNSYASFVQQNLQQNMMAMQSNSSSITNVYNQGQPGGGGSNAGVMRGIRGIMMLHMGMALAEEVEQQNAPWRKVGLDEATGSATAERRAVEAAVSSESLGVVNTIANPIRSLLYGYDAGQSSRDLIAGESDVSRMAEMRIGATALTTARMQLGVEQLIASGDASASREAQRQLSKFEAYTKADQEQQKRVDDHNYSGRRQAAEAAFNQQIGYSALGEILHPTSSADRAQTILSAGQTRDAALAAIEQQRRQDAAQTTAAKALADARYNTEVLDESRSEGTKNLKTKYDVREIGRRSENALGAASGELGTSSDQLRKYNDDLKSHIELLKETAKQTDDLSAKRLNATAAAEEAARGDLVLARSRELETRSDAQIGRVGGMMSSIRAHLMRARGDTLGAANEEASQRHTDEMTELGLRLRAGVIDQSEYAKEAAVIDKALAATQMSAGKMEDLRKLAVSSTVDEAGIDNPYDARRESIRNRLKGQAITDAAHYGDDEQEAAAELARIDREQGRDEGMTIFRNRAASADMNLRLGNPGRGIARNTQLADARQLNAREVEELTAAQARGQGGAALRSIRDKYRTEAEQMLRHTGVVEARIELEKIVGETIDPLGGDNTRGKRNVNAPAPAPNVNAPGQANPGGVNTSNFEAVVAKFSQLVDRLLTGPKLVAVDD